MKLLTGKGVFFGKVADPQSSTSLEDELHYKYFLTDLSTF